MNDESNAVVSQKSDSNSQIRRAVLDLIWLAPGTIALSPYFMNSPQSLSVVDQLGHLFGVYGWLLAHPIHLLIALPTVVYIVHWIRRGGRYAR